MDPLKKLFVYLSASVLPFLAAEAILIIVVSVFKLIYQGLMTFVFGLNQGFSGLENSSQVTSQTETAMSLDVSYIISVAAVLICGIVFYFWYRQETRGQMKGKLREIVSLKNLYRFLMLGVGCQLFFSGVMNLIQPIFYKVFENYGNTIEGILGGNLLIVLVYTVVVAPIAEELIFRGVILQRSRKVIPFLGANILQAAFFGLYHQNIVQGIYATFVGLLLGLVYRKYNSIYAPIFLHMMINVSIFLVMIFPSTMPGFIIMLILGALFCTFSMIGLDLLNNKKILAFLYRIK